MEPLATLDDLSSRGLDLQSSRIEADLAAASAAVRRLRGRRSAK